MLPAWFLLALLVAHQTAAGEPQQKAQEELPVFRVETKLALVRFHVVRKNLYVDDLKPEDVVLLEDGTPRKLSLFEGGRWGGQPVGSEYGTAGKPGTSDSRATPGRTIPVELILLFDISGSVTQQGLLDPLAFKHTLLDGVPNVRLAVYGFDSTLRRFCRPTRDTAELAGAFQRVLNFRSGAEPKPVVIRLQLPPKRKRDPRGGTWIFEAVLAAAKDAASWPGAATRMLMVFSDGFATTTSRPEDAATPVSELGIPVYPVALGHYRIVEQIKRAQETGYDRMGVLTEGARQRLGRLEDQEREIVDFASLGELTGGRSFDPREINLNILRQILAAMVAQIRCEYVLGFTPTPAAGQPARHKLQVKLRSKDTGKVLGGSRAITY